MMKNYLFIRNTGQRNSSSSHYNESIRGKRIFHVELRDERRLHSVRAHGLRAALLCHTKALCPISARQDVHHTRNETGFWVSATASGLT